MEVGRSNGEKKAKKPSDKDLDLNNAGRGVWLVKVPNYISDRWRSAKEGSQLGKLTITRRPNNPKPAVDFTLSEEVAAARSDKDKAGKPKEVGQAVPLGRTNKEVPKEHKFVVQSVAAQSLAVFSHVSGSKGGAAAEKEAAAATATAEGDKEGNGEKKEPLLAPGPDKLALEGKVVQRAECRPISDGLYMSLKREAIVRAIEPAR